VLDPPSEVIVINCPSVTAFKAVGVAVSISPAADPL